MLDFSTGKLELFRTNSKKVNILAIHIVSRSQKSRTKLRFRDFLKGFKDGFGHLKGSHKKARNFNIMKCSADSIDTLSRTAYLKNVEKSRYL
jgi:hypothetical protein